MHHHVIGAAVLGIGGFFAFHYAERMVINAILSETVGHGSEAADGRGNDGERDGKLVQAARVVEHMVHQGEGAVRGVIGHHGR
jgi:hypothetical protein